MNPEIKKFTYLGAYGIIVQDGKLLVALKKSGPYTGLWGLPGGGIEFNESPEQALIREIQEETALAAEHLELLTVMTSNGEYEKDGQRYQYHHIGIIYRINKATPIPDLQPEDELRWIPLHQVMLKELTPFAKQSYETNLLWK